MIKLSEKNEITNAIEGSYRAEIQGPFYKFSLYNKDGNMVSSHWLDQLPNLDNRTELDRMPFPRGDDEMATKIVRSIIIDGTRRWVRCNTEQEYCDKLAALLRKEPKAKERHLFGDYALSWFETYSKPNIGTATATTYQRQLTRYLIPAFGEMAIEDITTDDVQKMFNEMKSAKSTKDKVRVVLNQIMEAAKDDKLIAGNPLKSRRLRITGKASKTTNPYSVEQMKYLVSRIPDIKNPVDRAYLALQALHPMRLEEVLGLRWEDVDSSQNMIHIRQVVTHPTRNQPEVKEPKTESSVRTIGLSPLAVPYLNRGEDHEFLFGGSSPLSYTQVRRMCDRIQKDTNFSEKVTPIRFRTTTLSDIYDQTKDIKLVQALAGHTTSAMTLKYYVKNRESMTAGTDAIGAAYTT